MPTPGAVKGAPSFTIQTLYRLPQMRKGKCTAKPTNRFYKLSFKRKNNPRGQLAPSGEACSSKEYRWRNPREMANSRGLALAYHNNYTSPFPRENYQGSDTYVVGACHLLCLNELRVLYDLGWWLDSLGRQRGYGLVQRESSNFLRRFFFVLSRPLGSALKVNGFRVLTFIAPWIHVTPGTCRLPIGPLGAGVHRGEI